jgi:hypothetical protein
VGAAGHQDRIIYRPVVLIYIAPMGEIDDIRFHPVAYLLQRHDESDLTPVQMFIGEVQEYKFMVADNGLGPAASFFLPLDEFMGMLVSIGAIRHDTYRNSIAILDMTYHGPATTQDFVI